ncbi:FRG domain-containing protein [Microbacterium sp. ZXX196]|uniref:FRG domain-containing protein n=1 Tax=Microbacterium sp. ZXX196 TaxID=2609291 RepID=UPI0012B847C5|nr:FRG domain-containing protein [Microbacterium sp. ZXX196]MTE23215.1 FRG domain-containing protein [Microbacterium sp. ZXX196]
MATQPATNFFREWEPEPIQTWSDFQEQVNELTGRYQDQRLLWRGARNANWGVESSLYRALREVLGRPPIEQEMVDAEKEILDRARTDWRFDGKPALEIFAELQHVGGPTRLLDVTENPMFALWFATERPVMYGAHAESESDGRILAFVAPDKSDISLNSNWHTRDPLWHTLSDDAHRAQKRWGTGTWRRYWRPPVYHARIAAQGAGFLLDGVPIDAGPDGLGFVAPGERSRWSVEDMREYSSMALKLTRARDGHLPADRAPVFTFRVAHRAKEEIRDQLERRYGIRTSTMYPDMYGLAVWLGKRPESLVR